MVELNEWTTSIPSVGLRMENKPACSQPSARSKPKRKEFKLNAKAHMRDAGQDAGHPSPYVGLEIGVLIKVDDHVGECQRAS